MKISKKSRNGIAALIDLAVNAKTEHIPLTSVSQHLGISLQYLEQIFAPLKKSGIVKSIKGAQGGYQLAKKPEDITLGDILDALEGAYHLEPMDVEFGQPGEEIYSTIQSQIIEPLNIKLDVILAQICLKDLVDNYETKRNQTFEMYYI